MPRLLVPSPCAFSRPAEAQSDSLSWQVYCCPLSARARSLMNSVAGSPASFASHHPSKAAIYRGHLSVLRRPCSLQPQGIWAHLTCLSSPVPMPLLIQCRSQRLFQFLIACPFLIRRLPKLRDWFCPHGCPSARTLAGREMWSWPFTKQTPLPPGGRSDRN